MTVGAAVVEAFAVGIARGCRVVCTFGLRTLAKIIAAAARATRPTRTNANHAITSAMLKKFLSDPSIMLIAKILLPSLYLGSIIIIYNVGRGRAE